KYHASYRLLAFLPRYPANHSLSQLLLTRASPHRCIGASRAPQNRPAPVPVRTARECIHPPVRSARKQSFMLLLSAQRAALMASRGSNRNAWRVAAILLAIVCASASLLATRSSLSQPTASQRPPYSVGRVA